MTVLILSGFEKEQISNVLFWDYGLYREFLVLYHVTLSLVWKIHRVDGDRFQFQWLVHMKLLFSSKGTINHLGLLTSISRTSDWLSFSSDLSIFKQFRIRKLALRCGKSWVDFLPLSWHTRLFFIPQN